MKRSPSGKSTDENMRQKKGEEEEKMRKTEETVKEEDWERKIKT